MSTLVVTVPLPPSANKLTRNVPGKGRVSTSAYRAWTEEASWHAIAAWRTAGKPAFTRPLQMTLDLGLADRRRDAGNTLKPIEDMLVKAIEGLPDDRWNDLILIRRSADVKPGSARVTIASIDSG